ncbi:MAG: TolC family protein [Deltaproteobacteria bacterium]|nr:TolC family protein [Deltaproteobacteria bacterium]
MRIKVCLVSALSILTLLLLSGTTAAETLTLGEGLKIVTEKGRLARIAAYDEEIARDSALIARASLFPRVNASLNQTFLAHQPQAIFGNATIPTSQQDFLAYSISVQQTLYDFKRTASRYAAGRTRVDTQKLDTQKIRNLAAIEFALAYYDLLEAEHIAKVAAIEVERLQSHLKDAKDLYTEGVITKNDLLQAEVRLSDAGQRLISARNFRAINASRINNALLRPLTAEVAAAEVDKPNVDYLETNLEKAWEIGLKERPEIKIAEETLKTLGLEEQAKKAEFYPELFVRGGYDYTENRYQLYEGNWAMILGVGVNLFSGGSTKAEVARIEHQKSKLREEKEKLVDDIKLEVQRNLLDTQSARQKIAVVKDALQQAEENLRINKTRYQEGVGTATEVLDAVTLLTVAETNHYRALYDLGRAEAAAMYSQGQKLAEAYK